MANFLGDFGYKLHPGCPSSDHRNANSRLGCQVAVTPALAGITVTIAKED